jgi:membrane fusion protein (multidrug efflux system)
MAEKLLKFPDAVEQSAAAKPADSKPADSRHAARKKLRMVLLIVVPTIAAVAGLGFYLSGGRYISTDNAYVGAQKVLITPDISGKIATVTVTEGRHVAAGDELFAIDPVPFRLAVTQAESKLATVRSDFATLKTNLDSYEQLVALAENAVELKQRDVDRKSALATSHAGSQLDVDNSKTALVAAQNQLAQLKQQLANTRNQLLGDPNLAIEQYPPYMQAQAALDQAERDLAHATLRAPIAGTATQVDNIQLGRYVTAGTPVFSIIDDATPWVDANPKETDITYLRPGQTVALDVDAFPGQTFHGTVAAVSPGTGAQFAILPPQNASGNWVKVVQRVPVRIAFDPDQDTKPLRSGMSVKVEIDTGRSRTLGKLIGSLFAPPTSLAEEKKVSTR